VTCRRKELLKCEECGRDGLLRSVGVCSFCGTEDRAKKSVLEKHLDLCYAVHAEERAILQALKKSIPLESATLYCTTYPCLMCAKIILESKISRVVYVEPYPYSKSKEILESKKVPEVHRFRGFTIRNLYRVHATTGGNE
jgi:dCMP deaminase